MRMFHLRYSDWTLLGVFVNEQGWSFYRLSDSDRTPRLVEDVSERTRDKFWRLLDITT
jgi:hypothetical protein